MPGFDQTNTDEENAIRDRGLTPFRIRFSIQISDFNAAKKLRGSPVVISCERKSQVDVTEPRPGTDGVGSQVDVNQKVRLHLVLARRNGFGMDGLDQLSLIQDGAPLQGFETIMARFTVHKNSIHGPVVDCAVLNLSKFVAARHSKSSTKLSMQLGGSLTLSIEAKMIFDEAHLESSSEDSSQDEPQPVDVPSKTEDNGVSDGNNDLVSRHALPATVNDEHDWDKCKATASLVSFPSGYRPENPRPVDKGISRPSYSTGQRNFSFCTSESDVDSKGGDEKEGRNDNAASRVPDEEESGPLTKMKTSRLPAREYETPYSEGIWRETPTITKVDAPVKLVFWNIDGPDEPESEDEDESDDEDSEMPRKKKVHKHSRMVLTTTKRGPPAKVGKLSLLQKSCMTLQDPCAPPPVIDLGAPVSLKKSCVLRVTKLLANDVQYIDEPPLSDSHSDEKEEEEDEDEDEDDEDEEDDEIETEEEYEVDETATSSAAAKDGGASSKQQRRYSSTTDSNSNSDGTEQPKIQNKIGTQTSSDEEKGSNGSNKTGRTSSTDEELAKPPSLADCNDSKFEMAFQIGELQKICKDMKAELMVTAADVSKLARENVNLRNENSELKQTISELEGGGKKKNSKRTSASSTSSGEKECQLRRTERGSPPRLQSDRRVHLQRQLDVEKQENERLLGVILELKNELDREPAAPEFVRMLSQTKLQLAEEKIARQKLEKRVGKEKKLKNKKKGFFGFGGSKSKSTKKDGTSTSQSPNAIDENVWK